VQGKGVTACFFLLECYKVFTCLKGLSDLVCWSSVSIVLLLFRANPQPTRLDMGHL
jgi:hypothetical protein